MNLTLIGMSGAGKSYIGRKVADALTLTFLDLDEAMELEYGKPLPVILEEKGDEGFIAEESRIAIEQTKGQSNLLISTGGSIVYADDAMQHLRNISHVVYLDVPIEVIERRVGGSSDRLGRIVGLGERSLRELFESRIPLYLKYAHASVHPEVMTLEHIVEKLVESRNGTTSRD